LVAAAVFAIWLNAALLESFMAPVFQTTWGRGVNWAILIAFWLLSFRRAARRLSQIYHGDAQYNDELLARAQTEYLRGQWFEAESLLLRLVREQPDDAEGRLLLATLYRHTRRPELARTHLDRLERRAEGARWRWEILQERTLGERTASVLAAQSTEAALVAEPAAPASRDEDADEIAAEPGEPGGLSKAA
jgi:hypothetical protein